LLFFKSRQKIRHRSIISTFHKLTKIQGITLQLEQDEMYKVSPIYLLFIWLCSSFFSCPVLASLTLI
jgi:hypothetical protein